MKKTAVTLMFFLMGSSSSAYAEWSGSGDISNLRLYNATVILAGLSSLSTTESQAYCGTTSNGGQFSLAIDKPYSNLVQSMILSAEIAGRTIKVHLTGTCLEGRPEINGAWVIDK